MLWIVEDVVEEEEETDGGIEIIRIIIRAIRIYKMKINVFVQKIVWFIVV